MISLHTLLVAAVKICYLLYKLKENTRTLKPDTTQLQLPTHREERLRIIVDRDGGHLGYTHDGLDQSLF
jgi:hypothetical protein